MKAEKIRNLTDVELKHQERELTDQLFRLRFQLQMGQTESLKKIRRTDLWTVIEVLQRRLERQGLSTEVVDAAITRAVSDALRR